MNRGLRLYCHAPSSRATSPVASQHALTPPPQRAYLHPPQQLAGLNSLHATSALLGTTEMLIGFIDENQQNQAADLDSESDDVIISPVGINVETERSAFLHVSVSGTTYLLLKTALRKYPDTVLGKLATLEHQQIVAEQLCDAYWEDKPSDEFADVEYIYYFNRSPLLFDFLLQFYRTGILHKPQILCSQAFRQELQHFKILPRHIRHCCAVCMQSAIRQLEEELAERKAASQSEIDGSVFSIGENGQRCFGRAAEVYSRCRRKAWMFLENPIYSKLATCFSALSISFIMITAIIVILESMPEFRHTDCPGAPASNDSLAATDANLTKADRKGCPASIWSACISNETLPIIILQMLDTVCIVWFTFEYLIRLWAAPNRWQYVKSPLSIVDLLAILPFFAELLLLLGAGLMEGNCTTHNIRRSMQLPRLLRIIRVFRVIRVLKLARYWAGMKILAVTLRNSSSELLLMSFYTMMATFFFSTLLYYIEGDIADSPYFNIPEGAWWSIVTLFQFADAPPVTVGGKFVSVFGTMVGILLLAFPISSIVENFSRVYREVCEETAQERTQGAAAAARFRSGARRRGTNTRQDTTIRRGTNLNLNLALRNRIGSHTAELEVPLQASPSVKSNSTIQKVRTANRYGTRLSIWNSSTAAP